MKHDHPDLSVRRQCSLLSLARSSLYYHPRGESAENLAFMEIIDKQFLETPWYGSRQMARHMQREGHRCGRHRVRRLMRLMRLVPIYQEPKTSKKHPEHKIYLYLLKDLPITRPNQVWCADITYIPMRRGFLYLVAVMDWHSRKVLSWRLSNSMDAVFCVEVLKEALAKYGKPEIFNTDQGSQFTSTDFTDVLRDAKVKISMPLGVCMQTPVGNRWSGPLDRQPDDRAALAVPQIRVCLPERLRDRLGGPTRDRRMDHLLQRKAPALIARAADTGRGL